MSRLFAIPAQLLPNVINHVYPKIEAAVAYSNGKYVGKDIIEKIISRDMQLWAAVDEENEVIDGIAITEIAVYPRIKVCHTLCATGDNMAEWVGFIKEIEAWGKAEGCQMSEITCRPGWEKMLKPYDYKRDHVILKKELN